jgi:hypothetical protein
MNKAPVFNVGSPVRKQCAQRADGVWFVRHRRLDAPGYTAWLLAPFTTRPPYSWYDGQHARLPKWKQSDDA